MGAFIAAMIHPVKSAAQEAQINMPSIMKYGKPCISGGTKVPPLNYPKLALEKGLSGWVVVQFDVIGGKTSNLAVAASSSNIFNESALEVARGIDFEGHLDKFRCAAPFRFILED